MSEDEYDEDDLDLIVDFEKQSASKEEIKTRIDQYLTASKLGRMAFMAGDIQLAKDRFNLAMSLEMQTELENNVDFGVTGGLLREEMVSRRGADSLDNADRFGAILSRLLQVFEHADAMVGTHPKDSSWYVTMASCLCVVNEWDKAETVYKEGLKMCPGNKDLMKSMQSLQKVKDTLSEFMSKAGVEKSNSDRSNSPVTPTKDNYHFIDGSDLAGPKFRPINVEAKRQCGSLGNPVSVSSHWTKRLSNQMRLDNGQRSRSKSFTAANHVKHSNKRLSLSQKWNEHSIWRTSFSPLVQSEKLDQGFSSRTLRTMRTINSTSDIDVTLMIEGIS